MRGSRARGFTLIEMAITAAIVALLATIVLPMAEMAVQRTKEQELRSALRQIREALDAYKQAADAGRIEAQADASGYPPTLQVLVDGVADIKNADTSKSRIYFLRRIPRDPFNENVTLSADQTWGKRSYSSSAEAPKEGGDVFDIYSLAPGSGLNGVPYRDW